ncbi:hypothetical protein Aperf_G00000028027 [Anoplocephala perfoliata]
MRNVVEREELLISSLDYRGIIESGLSSVKSIIHICVTSFTVCVTGLNPVIFMSQQQQQQPPPPTADYDSTAIEATEDLDYVDLVLDQYGSNFTVPSSLPGSPLHTECPQLQNSNTKALTASSLTSFLLVARWLEDKVLVSFMVGEQEASKCPEVYRLPQTVEGEEASAALDDLTGPIDQSQLSITVKPSNTNYRARFSVPKSSGRGSTLQQPPPQLDLLSELQIATDSTFPLTGLSSIAGEGGGGTDETEAACSTSDQVSEIVNELAVGENRDVFDGDVPEVNGNDHYTYCPTATSSSRNTVLTSTSTIRPANSCSSLASPSCFYDSKQSSSAKGKWALYDAEITMELPKATFRRSSSDLLIKASARDAILCGSNGECWKRFMVPFQRRATFTTPPPPHGSWKQHQLTG